MSALPSFPFIPLLVAAVHLALAQLNCEALDRIPSDPLRDSFDKIRWKAQSGDPYYQGYLGICHRTGYKGAQLSKAKARHWSQLSAQKLNPLGLANLGAVTLWESQGLLHDKAAHRRKVIEARQHYEDAYLNGLFRLAQDKGDPLAADLLGDYYHISSTPSPAEMERYYRAAIAKGYPRSMAALGVYQIGGYHSIKKNPSEAVFHFENAAKQGLPVGLFNLAIAYMDGDGINQDLGKARSLLNQAADKGFAGAARRLEKLDSILRDNPSATHAHTHQPAAVANTVPTPTIKLAPEAQRCLLLARAGDAEAQRRLGLMYWVGKGVPKNLAEARHWLSQAASRGDTIAKQRLALLNKLY